MKQSARFILSGGGTGGHIYPAVAIAKGLKKLYPDAEFLFVGARDRMEMEKVPQAGFTIEGLWISGLQRKLTLKNLLFPFKLLNSLWRAYRILKRFKPDLVIGTGGFASGPTLFMASKLGIKTLIQEQNSYPGITNKLLAKKADRICVAYDNLERFFPVDKIIKTGNPVRQDLLNIDQKREEALSFFDLDKTKLTLVVLGGSLGARYVNQLIEKELDWLVQNDIQVIWQTGKLYESEYAHYSKGKHVQTYAFLNRMDLTYAAADIIVSRAGASSISELCLVGKPVLFIPSPNVAEDHQTKNALAVVNEDAGLLMKESELSMFKNLIGNLIQNEQLRSKLGKQIKMLALPDATQTIISEIEKLLKKE
jgi:UDP-N-acetylglucosamine--N-acetylmuramyl-(pentapeptide) pyrophosphoryl-undecaprenol N-acetylglucosamine transferase